MVMFSYLKSNKKIIFYTICFALLGVIETQNEALLNMPFFDNSTGLLFAILAISSYNLKELKKRSVIISGITGILFGICFAVFSFIRDGAFDITAYVLILTSVAAGFALSLFVIFKGYKKLADKKYRLIVILWGIMMLLTLVSRYDSNWHKWLFLIGIAYYGGNWNRDKLREMMTGACNGIIICFFLIQGAALAFRPYERINPRYCGLYVNCSRNAAFYLMVYTAFLNKLFWLKGKKILFTINFLFACSIPAFILFTGSKSGFLGTFIVTLFFLCSYAIERKSVAKFLTIGLLIVGGFVVSIPIVFGAIRYVPAIIHHPIWVMGDIYDPYNSVHSWDSIDSDKYMDLSYALDINIGRMIWFINDEFYGKTNPPTTDVSSNAGDEPIYQTETLPPTANRKAIWKWYLNNLNIVGGHRFDENGVQVTPLYRARHAHNTFIQWAFDFGLISGILYLGLTVSLVICGIVDIIKKKDIFISTAMTIFPLAFSTFGFFEYDWSHRQISFAMLWVCMLYLFVRKCLNKTEEEN